MAQFAPYSDFQNMSEADLANLQAKLTYGGIQEEPVSTVVITRTGGPFDINQFTPFRHPGFSYGNDSVSVQQVSASAAQLHALIANAGTVPAVPAGGVGTPPYISFALVNNVGGSLKGFEVVLNPSDAISLLSAIRAALSGAVGALGAIDDFGCATASREPGTPTDVTSSVSVTISGFRLNRATGRFVGTATLKNNAASSIPIPVSLVLGVPSDITVFNSNGSTCGTAPAGRPFVNASLGASLAPGATTDINLDLVNPNRLPSPVTATKVLAGPGGR
jgi:hypothetical protein